MSCKISVQICSYNRKHLLERSLRALMAQDLPNDQYEIVFVDDGSTDGSADMARALAAQNKPKEALDVYEKLIGGIAKPDILPVNTEIAWLAETMGDYKRAELAGQAVLAIPDLDPAYRKVWTIRVADLQQRSAQAK